MAVQARTVPQFKSFNTPFQMGLGFCGADDKFFEGPADAQTLVFQVEEGDVVIAASDGWGTVGA